MEKARPHRSVGLSATPSTLSHWSAFRPWYDFSALSKLNNYGTNRKTACDFLVVNNSYFGRILYRYCFR